MWIGLSGCAANFGIALVLSLLARILVTTTVSLGAVILFFGVSINLILAFFNLIPIPPLDGSKILTGILPERYAYTFSRIEPFGFIILFILLLGGALNFLFLGVARLAAILTGMPFYF